MNVDYNTTNFEQFISKYSSSRDKDLDEIKNFFLSFDKKMKMYHENNYIITSFRLQDIIVYESNNDGHNVYDVDFKYYTEKENTNVTMRENIFYSACLAVGVYNNCLSYINPDKPNFLKNNFYLFAENIPSDVVSYYRGVIERDAEVYLTEFVTTSKQQEIDRMKREMDAEAQKEAELQKNKDVPKPKSSIQNDTWGTSDAAFSSVALFPIIFSILGILIPILFVLFY
jgi:hypothetical protein